MGGHTMREGLTVGRSLSAAAIVRLRRAGVNGSVAFYTTPSTQPRACSHCCSPFALTLRPSAIASASALRRLGRHPLRRYH